jgi:hypothetical protein
MNKNQIQNPYKDESGKSLLRRSIVTFLDILGYRDQVRKAFETNKGETLLLSLRKALDESYHHIKEEAGISRPWVVKGFTDNFVIGFPFFYDAESEMGYIFSNLCAFQLMLVVHGFFIRGGLAIGDLYMDDEIVFGKGLLEALETEKNLARDPRIVLSRTAIQYLDRHVKYYSRIEVAPQYDHVLKDRDGQVFINYLNLITEFEADYSVFLDEFKMHKKVVESRLKEYVSKPPIWDKYLWVANYHNWFCDQSPHFDESYKIDLSEIPVGPSRIG